MSVEYKRIQLLSRTSADLTAINPILLDGELSIADVGSTLPVVKIGDGVRAWVDLPPLMSEAAQYIAGATTMLPAGADATVTIDNATTPPTISFSIPRGPTGPPGPEGPMGSSGVQGPTGPPPNLTVSSTTTGAAGSDALVTIAGSSPNYSLAFTIPRGDTGATGADGPQGPVGETGAEGPAGPEGPQGEQGPEGPAGSINGATQTLVTVTNELATLPNSRRLVAGTNITLDLGTAGQITINASGGGGGTPGGASGQIQYNSAGAFAGDADLTWDQAANTLSVGSATTTGIIDGGTGSLTIRGGLNAGVAAQGLFLNGRDGTASNGTGANVNLKGGNSGTSAGQPGAVVITGGNSIGTAQGGTVSLAGGPAGSAQGGTVNISGANGGGTNGAGGLVVITAGNALGSGAAGTISATAGNGSGSQAGGTITLNGGGAGSGSGGNVSLLGGISTLGPGGSIILTARNSAGTNVGGAITLTAGNGASQLGGAISLTAGMGQSTFNGGAVTIAAGPAGPGTVTGRGGTASLRGGAGGSGQSDGGDADVRGGTPTDGHGGHVTIAGITGVGTNRNGGNVTITAGDRTGTGTQGVINFNIGATNIATITNGPTGLLTTCIQVGTTASSGTIAGRDTTGTPSPGNLVVRGGSTAVGGSGSGGTLTLQGGGARTDGQGGDVNIQAQPGIGTNRGGGDVTIQAGASTGTGAAGDISITAGNAAGAGAAGKITLTGGTTVGGAAGSIDLNATAVRANGAPVLTALTRYKTADTLRTGTATPAADPELSFTDVPAGVYAVEGWLAYQSSSEFTGLTLALGVSAAPTRGEILFFGNTFSPAVIDSFRTTATGTSKIPDGTNVNGLLIRGQITLADSTTDVWAQWSPSVANATTMTVRSGSWLMLKRIT